MSEENSSSHFQLLNEESSITGGKSVSEIVQLLRAKANLKLKVRDFDDNEDVEEQPYRTSQVFPWVKRFTTQCREVIPNPDIKKLDELVTDFLKHIEDSVNECYKRPKRAYKLKTRMLSFLKIFNMMYGQLKEPLEHASYLDKMSDVMAVYIDIELKSSRRGREHPKKISERICSSLYIFLDNSIEHILDSALKAKFFIKKYSDICCPIMARLLKEKPGPMNETTYVRYLLSFKLWKKLAEKEQYQNIYKEAVAKLIPPPDFLEKLRTGLFSNVLPYVSKSEKDRITLFFMQSPFNVKNKAQVFLKDEKKIQPNIDLERSFLFDDDIQITSFFDDDDDEELNNQPNALMNGIWTNLMEREDDCHDNIVIPMEIIDLEEDENIIVDIKKNKPKEKSKKIVKDKAINGVKDKAINGVIKTSVKKRKALKVNNNNIVKNLSSKDVVMDLIRPVNCMTPEETPVVSCVKTEDALTNCPDQKQVKPCAAVEPEQCREVTDSLSNVTQVLPIRLIQNPTTTSCSESVRRETHDGVTEERLKAVETSASATVTNSDLAIVNPTINKVDSLETTPTTTVDSSGIYEGIKSENLVNGLFDDPTDAFKIGKPDDERMLADSFVHEEVVISSDMEQDTAGCTFLYLQSDKIDQNDIMNVIGITRDTASFCNEEVIVDSELSIKEQEKHQIAIGSLLYGKNISKESQIKELSSGYPENQYLSSIIASTGTNESYVSLYRGQDSYANNDVFIQRFLSESTPVDDGSDDDSRFQNRRRFAGGGKIPAFRDQIEQCKSDNDEDFDPLTPSSDSQQQSSIDTSPEMISLQPPATESSSPESDPEMKNSQNAVEVEISPHSNKRSEKKLSPQEHGQMKELSVHLSLGDVISANEHISIKEKISPKGMFELPDDRLHFKTVDFDIKFDYYQYQLYNLYNTVENILETDPAPSPPQKVVEYPINGYLRCPCQHCCQSYYRLDRQFHSLHHTRNMKIINHVNKTRMLTKISNKKQEDDKLLKSIEDTITPVSSDLDQKNKTGLTSIQKSVNEVRSDSEQELTRNTNLVSGIIQTGTPVKETRNTHENVEGCERTGNRNEYASLPPKKRKAFTVENSDSQKATVEVENRPADESRKHTGTLEGSNRFSPVKIKAVDGSYCVLNENSSTSEDRLVVEADTCFENIPKTGRKKCRKHRSKEEKRLRREQKKLKKLKKLEEGSSY